MIFAPILGLFSMVLGTGFFMSFLSLHFKMMGQSEFHIGLAHSAFYLGMLLSSLRSERLISRVGHIRALTATCGLLGSVTAILFIIPLNQWFWFRFLAGACVGCFYVSTESWLLVEFPENKRGLALATYTISIYLAQSLSQLFLGSIKDNPIWAFLISTIFICFAVIPVSVGKSEGPDRNVADPESIIKYLKISPLGVVGCLLAGMILSTLYSYMPIYFKERSFEPGQLMTLMILGGVVLQYPIGKFSDHFERRKVLVTLGIIGAVISLVLVFLELKQFFQAGVFAMGGVLFTIYPVSMALGCDCVRHKDIVKMTGVLLFAYGTGSVIGPVIAPILQTLSKSYAVLSVGIYSLLLSSIGLYALYNRKNIKIVDQSDFTIIPNGPIVEDLHPHTSGESESEKASEK